MVSILAPNRYTGITEMSFTFTHVRLDGSVITETLRLASAVEAQTVAETILTWDRRVSSVTLEVA